MAMNHKERADELRRTADSEGIVSALAPFGTNLKILIPISKTMRNSDIDELNLSIRSRNGLLRAGLNTVGKVCEKIMDERGLDQLRNIGRKSISEIKTVTLAEAYYRLNDAGKSRFWLDFSLGNEPCDSKRAGT